MTLTGQLTSTALVTGILLGYAAGVLTGWLWRRA